MSVGYFATLAGENADAARSWKGATRSWQRHAAQLEQDLDQANLRIEGLEYQLQKAEANNASWQAHAKQLEAKIRAWQQSAIESEAISRAKTAVVEEVTEGKAPIDFVGEERFAQIIEDKKGEVIEQWGINPWENE